MSDTGEALAGIPILSEVVTLEDLPEVAESGLTPADLPDDPQALIPMQSGHQPVEVRLPAFSIAETTEEAELREASSPQADDPPHSSRFAAIWGLLRGFAGTRERVDEDA